MSEKIIDSICLFNDLKDTNLKMEDFKEILSSYRKLENDYIKTNQVDLLKDLNKQKKVIFSYLSDCKDISLKKANILANELEREFGNFDEVDTLETPKKDIQLVKIAYKDGKWTVGTKNLSEDLVIDNVPQGIDNIVSLTDRLDEQEAAYALNHAKVAGKFTIAALPYVRTDMPDTAWSTRYMKEPTVPLGPYEKSEDSVSTHNMPVSRQFASEDEDLVVGDKVETNDGNLYEIVAVSESELITSSNDVLDKTLAKGKLESGEWKKVESAKDDLTAKEELQIKKLGNSISDITEKMKEHQIKILAIKKLSEEMVANLMKLQEKELEEEADFIKKMEPKIKRVLRRIDEITFKNEDCIKKLQVLKVTINGIKFTYNRGVEEYRKTVVSVKQVEEILEEIRKYVSPRYIKEYEKLTAKLFKFVSRSEDWGYQADEKDPLVQKEVYKQMDTLRDQNLKASLNNEFKEDAYNKLDDLFVGGVIDFNQYNTLTDYAELDGKAVLAALKPIEASLKKTVKASVFDSIKNMLSDAFNAVKEWISDTVQLFTIQDKQITDINEKLDKILED